MKHHTNWVILAKLSLSGSSRLDLALFCHLSFSPTFASSSQRPLRICRNSTKIKINDEELAPRASNSVDPLQPVDVSAQSGFCQAIFFLGGHLAERHQKKKFMCNHVTRIFALETHRPIKSRYIMKAKVLPVYFWARMVVIIESRASILTRCT